MEQEVPTFALDILQDVIDEGEREFELTQQRNSLLSQREKESSSEDEEESEVSEEESKDLFPPLADFVDWNQESEEDKDGKQEEEPKEIIRKKRKIFLDD